MFDEIHTFMGRNMKGLKEGDIVSFGHMPVKYCECEIPSPSSHHQHCLNDECGKRIESVYQKSGRQAARIYYLEQVIGALKLELLAMDYEEEELLINFPYFTEK